MPKFNTAFTCVGRGGHYTTGVALKKDINQHMDAEGETSPGRDVTYVLMASSCASCMSVGVSICGEYIKIFR